MTANHGKSHVTDLNKLVGQYNNTCHHSISKKPINAYYSALTEKTEKIFIGPKIKVNNRIRIKKYSNIFSKDYNEN